jgi:hypothetical protein
MGTGIYLVRDDGQLLEMTEQPYGSETLLQELLEAHPNLLDGDGGDHPASSGWLAIMREATSLEDERNDRWSLDRVFLDREGVPTLVEVDCSGEGRVHQAAIGQLLAYAASMSTYWPVDALVAQFEANCRDTDRDPEQVFEVFFGSDEPEEVFWQQVKTNLQAGRLRLVIVADEVSSELRRMVEFLNEQMDPAEVIALEIKQYVSEDGLKTLVPRSIGRTAEANKKKLPTTLERRRWDENSFFAEFGLRHGEEEADIARQIYDWCQNRSELTVHWRTGETYGGFVVEMADPYDAFHELFKLGIDGGLEIVSGTYAHWEPFRAPGDWDELRQRYSSIGLALPPDPEERRSPNFSLSTLRDQTALWKVFDTFEWAIEWAIDWARRFEDDGGRSKRSSRSDSPRSLSW